MKRIKLSVIHTRQKSNYLHCCNFAGFFLHFSANMLATFFIACVEHIQAEAILELSIGKVLSLAYIYESWPDARRVCVCVGFIPALVATNGCDKDGKDDVGENKIKGEKQLVQHTTKVLSSYRAEIFVSHIYTDSVR